MGIVSLDEISWVQVLGHTSSSSLEPELRIAVSL